MSAPNAPVCLTDFPPKLDSAASESLGERLAPLAELPGELHLDFSEVEYVSSPVLAELVSAYHKKTRAGGRLVLLNVGEFPYEVFETTQLTRFLDIRRKIPA